MAQLTAGMYEYTTKPRSKLFDLGDTNVTAPDLIIHNAGWYNKAGEKLGWGDLSAEDFKRISKGLEPEELFIILCEDDSFWNFVIGTPCVGCRASVDQKAQAPGIDYVAEKAKYVIIPGKFYNFDTYGAKWLFSKKTVLTEYKGLVMNLLTRKEMKKLIVTSTTPTAPNINLYHRVAQFISTLIGR